MLWSRAFSMSTSAVRPLPAAAFVVCCSQMQAFVRHSGQRLQCAGDDADGPPTPFKRILGKQPSDPPTPFKRILGKQPSDVVGASPVKKRDLASPNLVSDTVKDKHGFYKNVDCPCCQQPLAHCFCPLVARRLPELPAAYFQDSFGEKMLWPRLFKSDGGLRIGCAVCMEYLVFRTILLYLSEWSVKSDIE